jgi:DNA-binding transcriptional LysR family regulator
MCKSEQEELATHWRWDDVRYGGGARGSLSGAAKVLGVDHVTVGRRIAGLEEQFHTKLLSRTPDGLTPTSAGQTILTQCETMQGAALALERMIAGQDTRTVGAVRLTATDVFSRHVLMPVVVALRKSHPELQIDLLTGIRPLDIARREADLAVRVSTVRPADSQLVCRKLSEIGFTLYASNQYRARCGTPVRGQGLANHDLISFPACRGSFARFSWASRWKACDTRYGATTSMFNWPLQARTRYLRVGLLLWRQSFRGGARMAARGSEPSPGLADNKSGPAASGQDSSCVRRSRGCIRAQGQNPAFRPSALIGH